MKKNPIINKNVPTIFPAGFGMRKISDTEIYVIDFVDQPTKDQHNNSVINVISSIAFTQKMIKDLNESFKKFSGENDEHKVKTVEKSSR